MFSLLFSSHSFQTCETVQSRTGLNPRWEVKIYFLTLVIKNLTGGKGFFFSFFVVVICWLAFVLFLLERVLLHSPEWLPTWDSLSPFHECWHNELVRKDEKISINDNIWMSPSLRNRNSLKNTQMIIIYWDTHCCN